MNLKLLKYNVMVRKIKFRGKDIDTGDKSLTPEEVEEEKVKLENYWEGGKNELA